MVSLEELNCGSPGESCVFSLCPRFSYLMHYNKDVSKEGASCL